MEKQQFMIHSLRRRHFFTWIIIALILPVLFLLAWNEIPEASNQIGTKQLSNSTDPLVKVSEHHEGANNYVVLKLSRPAEKPSVVAYVGSSSTALVSESMLLGRVEGSGTYKFRISEELIREGSHLLFYDPINKKIIYSIPI